MLDEAKSPADRGAAEHTCGSSTLLRVAMTDTLGARKEIADRRPAHDGSRNR
jgi:hypothetical protein